MSDDKNISYAEAKEVISNLPQTWIPALFIVMVKSAIDKKVFQPGAMERLIQKIEIEQAQ